MSLLSVFAVLFMAMLLSMVMNVSRQVDGKIRMQNAADAAAYSGAGVMARAMNTFAFTNHLLCEAFAMTAFLREADSRIEEDLTQDPPVQLRLGDAEQFVPEILDAWEDAARMLKEARNVDPLLEKFSVVGEAMLDGVAGHRGKIAMERDLVEAFSIWAKQTAVLQLPLFEGILKGSFASEETEDPDAEPPEPTDGLIPKYQYAVFQFFPEIAQLAAEHTARHNGVPDFGRGDMYGVLWTGNGAPISEFAMPVVNPAEDAVARDLSRRQRQELVNYYMRQWNNQLLAFFGFDGSDIHVRRVTATMSQFKSMWEKYTCGYLNDLLSVHAETNHLYQIDRELLSATAPDSDYQAALQTHYTYLATVYWGSLPHRFPGVFHDPTGSDALAYAEARVFVPQPRLTWQYWPPRSVPNAIGGMPGGIQAEPGTGYGTAEPQEWVVMPQYYWYYRTRWNSPEPMTPEQIQEFLDRLKSTSYRAIFGGGGFTYAHLRPDEWTLLNQNWTAALVPATHPAWNTVLQTPPPGRIFQVPNTSGLGGENVQAISPH